MSLHHELNQSELNKIRVLKKVTWIGILCNILLAALKCILGYLGGSQAVVADGIHSLSDLITDFAILVGVKYWTAPADEKHPYGHHKYETVVSMIIGTILILASLGILYNAFIILRDPSLRNHPTLIASVAALLSIIVKEGLFRWTYRTGVEIKSSALQANAHHHRSDAISSIPALVSVLLAHFFPEYSFFDQIGAVIVSILIFKTAYDIITDALVDLLDTSASEEVCREIEDIVLNVSGVISTHKIRTRRIGYKTFVDLHIQVNGEMSVSDGHEISKNVRRKLEDIGPEICDVIVHLEPAE